MKIPFAGRKEILGALATMACSAFLPACSVTDTLYTAGGSAVGAAAGGLVGQNVSGNPALRSSVRQAARPSEALARS
jgi:hypothetical protein